MNNPFAGAGGKPILSRENANKHYVGRITVELFEGPNIENDANGLVMNISPALGVGISQQELLKRIAVALLERVATREKTNPEKVIEKYIQDMSSGT